MDKSFGQNDPKIAQYAYKTFHPEDETLIEIRKLSRLGHLPDIQIGPMDGLHLEVITRAMGATKAVEIGTLGGYSGVCIARGLPVGGKLYTFEMVPKHAEIARKAFQLAGLVDRTEVIMGKALENLALIEKHGPFDLVFIDADKAGYCSYLQWAEKNLRVGGVVLADNTFGFGHIADPASLGERDSEVAAIDRFNQMIARHPKFKSTILPTGEGMVLAVKL